MKNKVFLFILVVVSCCLMFRTAMIISTKSLINYVYRIMNNEIPLEEVEGTIYEHFHPIAVYPIDVDKFNCDVNIYKGWIFHDLKKGEINVIYHVSYYDDNEIFGGSNAPSKWLIEKKDGKWEIVEIIEKP